MAKTFRKRRAPRPLESLAQFAEACKAPVSTVSGWTKHEKWKWNRRAPWQPDIVPVVLRWAADELEQGRPRKKVGDEPAGSVGDLRRQKLEQEVRKLRANADQAESALARERGALHDADVCEEEAVRRATLFRNGVQNIPLQAVSMALSQGLPHEAAPAFQKQIEEMVNGCLRYLASTANAESTPGDDAGASGAVAA